MSEPRAADGEELLVIVMFAPMEAADVVRDAAASAGAGAIGNYRACSFSAPGEGRFLPVAGAQPAIGAVGTPEVVAEQRIEVVCPRSSARAALAGDARGPSVRGGRLPRVRDHSRGGAVGASPSAQPQP